MSTNSAINPLAYQLEDYGFSWASKDDLDLDLYSRQFFVLGAQTQKALASFNVLIIGATGVAVEVAKNVVLAGPKSVTVADNSPTQWTDLASQFYLSEEDVGKPRAACCVPKLAELNPHTEVHAYDGELTQEFLTGFQCVVVCDSNDEEALIQYNGWCHEANVPFIATTSRGLAGYVFSDFGKEFTVIDKTGEDELSGYILDISPEGLVSCTDDEPHGLSDEDSLTFSEVQGLSSLNGCEPVKIRVETPFSFTIQNFAAEGKYEGGGLWKQVKVPEVIEFNTLADELVKPTEFMLTDFGKFGRAEQLHVLFRGLDAYQKANDGALPPAGNFEAAAQVVELAKKWNEEQKAAGNWSLDGFGEGDENEKLYKMFGAYAMGQLNPMAAFFGGVVGQEVIKTSAGKFGPIRQWLYFDAFECMPDELLTDASEFELEGTRYDGQIAVFGKTFQQKVLEQNLFMVGCGALGCEFFKNFAMMGLGAVYAGGAEADEIEEASAAARANSNTFQVHTLDPSPELVIDQAVVREVRLGVTTRFQAKTNAVAAPLGASIIDAGVFGVLGNACMQIRDVCDMLTTQEEGDGLPMPMGFPKSHKHLLSHARRSLHGLVQALVDLGNNEAFASAQGYQREVQLAMMRATAGVDWDGEDAAAVRSALYECALFAWDEVGVANPTRILETWPEDSDVWQKHRMPHCVGHLDAGNQEHREFVVWMAAMFAKFLDVTLEGHPDDDEVAHAIQSHKHLVPLSADNNEESGLGSEDQSASHAKAMMAELEELDGKQLFRQRLAGKDDIPLASTYPEEFVFAMIATNRLMADVYHMHKQPGTWVRRMLWSEPGSPRLMPPCPSTVSQVAGFVGLQVFMAMQEPHSTEQMRDVFLSAPGTMVMSEPREVHRRELLDPNGDKDALGALDALTESRPDGGLTCWDAWVWDARELGLETVGQLKQYMSEHLAITPDVFTMQLLGQDAGQVKAVWCSHDFRPRPQPWDTPLEEFLLGQSEWPANSSFVRIDVSATAEDGEAGIDVAPIMLRMR